MLQTTKMFLNSSKPILCSPKLPFTIFFVLLLLSFLHTSALASATLLNKLQLPAIFFKSEQTFANYYQAEEQNILSKIDRAVCSNDNTPLPLPTQDEIFPYLERAGMNNTFAKEQGYTVFIKFYLDFCIKRRVAQELCLTEAACQEKLCDSYRQAAHKNAEGATQGTKPAESANSLEEVYDINARDLIAIP